MLKTVKEELVKTIIADIIKDFVQKIIIITFGKNIEVSNDMENN